MKELKKKEYNGDVYKSRSILRNIEINIKDENVMKYITQGIINETKYIISLNPKSDFSVIKLLITRGDEIKTIKINIEDIINNNFNELYIHLVHYVEEYIHEYTKEVEEAHYDVEHGFRLMEISYAKVFRDRKGGCNEGSRNKQCYETIHYLKNFIGYEKYEGCEFNYKVIYYKSINNNCGIVCLIKALDLKANEFKPDSISKEFLLNLKHS